MKKLELNSPGIAVEDRSAETSRLKAKMCQEAILHVQALNTIFAKYAEHGIHPQRIRALEPNESPEPSDEPFGHYFIDMDVFNPSLLDG